MVMRVPIDQRHRALQSPSTLSSGPTRSRSLHPQARASFAVASRTPGCSRRVTGLIAALLVFVSLALPSGAQTLVASTISDCGQAGRLVCLTSAAGGRTTKIHQGTDLRVTLRGGRLTWSAITQLPPGVLQLVGQTTRLHGASRSTFWAPRLGRATLRATSTPTCVPGEACPRFVLLWQTTILVIS